mmetsp:Transcript_112162/g.282329  ORF Transcript_112162/g.282329 Transcript_112162/m.282329 type:complete len:217 (-) Transcript_112162:92-742(-)
MVDSPRQGAAQPILDDCCCTRTCSNELWPKSGEVVHNHARDRDALGSVWAPPHATVEACGLEQAQGVVERCRWLCRRSRVADVMDQQGTHDTKAQLLVGNLHGPENVHAAQSSRDSGIALDRASGRGRAHVATHDVPIRARHHGAPMVQAFREDVVLALLDRDRVHEVQAACSDGLVRLQHAHGLEELHPPRCTYIVLSYGSRNALRHDVRIGGRA